MTKNLEMTPELKELISKSFESECKLREENTKWENHITKIMNDFKQKHNLDFTTKNIFIDSFTLGFPVIDKTELMSAITIYFDNDWKDVMIKSCINGTFNRMNKSIVNLHVVMGKICENIDQLESDLMNYDFITRKEIIKETYRARAELEEYKNKQLEAYNEYR